MSQLGEFLEVVFGPAAPFTTVRATIRKWRDTGLAEQASRAKMAMGRRKPPAKETKESRVEEARLSVWMKQPECLRIEKTRQVAKRTEPSLDIANGQRWWSRDHQGHVETSDAGEGAEPKRSTPGWNEIERHFDHTSLREYFASLALEMRDEVQAAGRTCIRLRAVPRPGAQLWPHWLPHGADEYEFHADPRYGILLFVAGKWNGQVFDSSEVHQIALDETLDDGLFVYAPRPGEQVRPPDPIVEPLSLEAAVARMPFTVLVPSPSPFGQNVRMDIAYHPPRLQSPRPYLTLMYLGESRLWITQSDSADPDEATMEWEAFERDGKRMAISDADQGMRVLTLRQDGTYATLWSDLQRERLIEIGASLVDANRLR